MRKKWFRFHSKFNIFPNFPQIFGGVNWQELSICYTGDNGLMDDKYWLLYPETWNNTSLWIVRHALANQNECEVTQDSSQNEGVRIKDLFPAQNQSAKSLAISERPNLLKLHYNANKFHEPPGVKAIYNVKLW